MITIEIFKRILIDDTPTIYAISNLGRVLNTKRNKLLTPIFKRKRVNKVLVDNEPNNMYIEYALHVNNKYYYKLAHRLVAEFFIPIPEKYLNAGYTIDDLVVDHIDNIRYHNNVENLQWMLSSENHDKMMEQGRNRIAYGSKHGNCNYTEEQLNLVGQLFEENVLTKEEISNITKIPYKTICSIYTGKKFSYLHNLYDFTKYNRKYLNKKYNEDTIRVGFSLLENNKYTLKDISNLTKINYSVLIDMMYGKVYKNIYKDYDLRKRLSKYSK